MSITPDSTGTIHEARNKDVTRLTSVLPQLQGYQFVGRRLVCLLFIIVVVASLLLATPYTASAHPLSGLSTNSKSCSHYLGRRSP